MMNRNINFNHILLDVGASNRKQLHKNFSRKLSKKTNLSEQKLLMKMLSQDKRSDTAIGNGVALSHLVFSEVNEPQIILARLKNSTDFDTPDNLPVDLYCIVLTPRDNAGIGLQLISTLSRVMQDAFLCDQLRCLKSEDDIYEMMHERQTIRRAA